MDSRLSCGYMCVPCGERRRENERPKEGKAPTHFELLQRNNSGRAALTFPRTGNLTLLAWRICFGLDIADVIYIVSFNWILQSSSSPIYYAKADHDSISFLFTRSIVTNLNGAINPRSPPQGKKKVPNWSSLFQISVVLATKMLFFPFPLCGGFRCFLTSYPQEL
jgi:hypothetical protein